MESHAAVAVNGFEEQVVTAVLENWRTAPINEKLRAALGFLEKLTLAPAEVTPADLEPLKFIGLSEQAIEEAIYVCFLFNVIDRLADAFDFQISSADQKRRVSRFLFNFGYNTGSVPG